MVRMVENVSKNRNFFNDLAIAFTTYKLFLTETLEPAMYHLQHSLSQSKIRTENQHITTPYFQNEWTNSTRFCIFAFCKPCEIRKVKTVVYHLQQNWKNQNNFSNFAP